MKLSTFFGKKITICVEYNTQERTVEYVNHVGIVSGRTFIDITEDFMEKMNGDKLIDGIDWEQVRRAEKELIEEGI